MSSSVAHSQPRTISLPRSPSLVDALWAPAESEYGGIISLAIALFSLDQIAGPVQLSHMLNRTDRPRGIGAQMQLFAFGNGKQQVGAYRNLHTNAILPRLLPVTMNSQDVSLIPENTELVFSPSSPGCLRCVLTVSGRLQHVSDEYELLWWTPKSISGDQIEIETGSSKFFTEQLGGKGDGLFLGLLSLGEEPKPKRFYAHMRARSDCALAILVKTA